MYVRTDIQVIFTKSYPTLKLIKQKMSKIIQINVSNFFYYAEILKRPSKDQKIDFGT